MTPREFQKIIWDYYRSNRRDFPWRNTTTPYKIAVSEIMLQQTQAPRIILKYQSFIKQFPNWKTLAKAPLREVLVAWQGLGYNRRGKALHELAQIIARDYHGTLPGDPAILKTLPGIGPATAASICAFAFNQPTVFIETNIRSVFIHFFFQDQTEVDDKDIKPLVEKTLDKHNPREWYFALMDYGVMLKATIKNPSRQSKHHTKQTKFEGSHRQTRGQILKLLTQASKPISLEEISTTLNKDLDSISRAVQELIREKYLVETPQKKLTIRETTNPPYTTNRR